MMHEALLNAYIFDFLRKKGFLQTAVLFADECKSLPLASATGEDPQVAMPSGLALKALTLMDAPPAVSAQTTNISGIGGKDSSSNASSTATTNTSRTNPQTHDSGSPGIGIKAEGSNTTLTPSPLIQQLQLHRVPAVNIPINTQKGFLLEWWSIFWDVFAASSDRKPGAAVPDSVRTYLQHQSQVRIHWMLVAAAILEDALPAHALLKPHFVVHYLFGLHALHALHAL
ncbi:hypothetical protein GQ54DRAFT_138516 [Martensiomyces pterosporus]|nr:hypothetical protein GQ54DRAFT_138516 [Martensiomyces pterosporus]